MAYKRLIHSYGNVVKKDYEMGNQIRVRSVQWDSFSSRQVDFSCSQLLLESCGVEMVCFVCLFHTLKDMFGY